MHSTSFAPELSALGAGLLLDHRARSVTSASRQRLSLDSGRSRRPGRGLPPWRWSRRRGRRGAWSAAPSCRSGWRTRSTTATTTVASMSQTHDALADLRRFGLLRVCVSSAISPLCCVVSHTAETAAWRKIGASLRRSLGRAAPSGCGHLAADVAMRAVLSSWPVASWKRRLNSSRRDSASRPSSSSVRGGEFGCGCHQTWTSAVPWVRGARRSAP